ncbi:phosphoribosylanthranilate isomerase [Sphingomonas sp. LB-2]|uniref:phosphoribosylanthranilate isomerase n=1 Tax=Sphingomonas caeni TaxID=2984949 RepID=UPI0022305DEA|nr:phosphoribosylanthranilate isomerase [Sphingomonas caeni]MCW3849073.1 phosphoribosylanthranilate isomerase [Sphingomonas caeni]
MPVTAKICGLSTPETLDAAIAGGASHVGFVFFPPSPRHLSFDRARQLIARVPAHIGKVGVFVDPDADLLDGAIACGIDTLQLHKVTPERAASMQLPVWAAVAVKTRADLDAASGFRGAVERVLYDAKTPEGALPGGMGLRFDWTLLQGFRHPVQWALSGGLDPGNVIEAARVTGAELVDVSSGVESAPGVKDPGRIAAFLGSLASL